MTHICARAKTCVRNGDVSTAPPGGGPVEESAKTRRGHEESAGWGNPETATPRCIRAQCLQ